MTHQEVEQLRQSVLQMQSSVNHLQTVVGDVFERFGEAMCAVSVALKNSKVVPASPDGGVRKREGVKKEKKKKDANRPKRARTPYLYFVMENEPIMREQSGVGPTGLRLKQSEIMSALGVKWKSLSEEQRKKYQLLADDDKLRYQRQVEAYQQGLDINEAELPQVAPVEEEKKKVRPNPATTIARR